MSWHCSRALVAEYSGDSSSGGERSAPSKSTPMPDQYYWPDKTIGHSRLSRFGMTSEPLTADRGEAVLTSFLAAFPARTLAPPGRAQESRASDPDCGWKWPGSSAKFDPASRTWRTRQCSLLGGLELFSETWPLWGSMRDGELCPQPIPAPLTCGSESGSLPTPTKMDATLSTLAKGGAIGRHSVHLSHLPNSGALNHPNPFARQAQLRAAGMLSAAERRMWATPQSHNATGQPGTGTTLGGGDAQTLCGKCLADPSQIRYRERTNLE